MVKLRIYMLENNCENGLKCADQGRDQILGEEICGCRPQCPQDDC